MALQSFLFGGSTNETPESIRRKRDIARALLSARAPQNIGEGLNALGDGIVSAVLNSRADKAEKAGQESIANDVAPLLGGFGGIPGATGSSMPKVDASGNVALPSTGKEWETIGPRLVSDLSKDFQLSPEQAAGVVGQLGQESAGFGSLQEKNPIVPGSRGGYGYAQWTGPRRKQFEAFAAENGLDPTSYEANYGFLKNELANTPEGAVLGDLRGAKDAMSAGRIFTDKFLRPGIPHYDSRDAWTQRALAFANAPTEVASLDPSAGMDATIKPPPVNPPPASRMPGYVDPMVTTDGRPQPPAPPVQQQPVSPAVAQALTAPQKGGRLGTPPQPLSDADFNSRFGADDTGAIPPQIAPQSALPPLPVTEVGPTPNVASGPPVADQPSQQVAQALLQPQSQQTDANAGYFPAAPNPPGQSGPSQAQIMRVLTNPFASESQRAVAQALLNRQIEASDPLRQLQIQEAQIKLDQARNPPADYDYTKMDDGTIVRTSKRGGVPEVVFQGQPKPQPKPSAVQEYEYAKEQGFPGTFQDWEASKKGGMSLQVDPATGAVTFQQGGNIKPMTEGQSKDAVYSTRAEGALNRLNANVDALTSLPETLASGLPIGGNYLLSPEYQQAQQAGKEFLQAILRKDTGAAITKQETDEYGTVYLPRPGDSKEVLAQKSLSRQRALEAIKAGMPPQAILAQEKALKESGDIPAAPATPASSLIDDLLKKYGTPQ